MRSKRGLVFRALRRGQLLQTRNKELPALLERASTPQKKGSKAKGVVFGEGVLMKLNARGAHRIRRVASLLAPILRSIRTRTLIFLATEPNHRGGVRYF
jgi:hypothetical protein